MVDEWDSFDKMPVRNGLFSQEVITSKGILFGRYCKIKQGQHKNGD